MTLAPEALAELKRRLREAEDTIRAIREGEVDALVVGALDQEEVFSIGGDADAFRVFLEAMQHGAAALDGSGRLLYANAVFAGLVGHPVEAMRGHPVADFLPPDMAALLERMIAAPEAHPAGLPVVLATPAGPRHALVSVAPLKLGTTRGFALTLTDLTERQRAEQAERSGRVAAAVIRSANEAVMVCDLSGRVTHANAAARGVFDGDPVGHLLAEIVPLVFTGSLAPADTADMLRQAMSGAALQGLEAQAPETARINDLLVSAAPLMVAEGEVAGCVVTLVDLTQRKALERQQLLLMRELDHRVKNILAMVLSISRRTRRNSTGVEDFMESFTGRIHALSATHNLLAQKSWTELGIAEILAAELAPFDSVSRGRIALAGLDRMVTPRAAVALGILFHELTTNAVKHGALKGEGGSIAVSAGSEPGGGLLIDWKEQVTDPVTEPTRQGFGTVVIAQSMLHAPGGGTELLFEPDGLRCRITIPSEDIA
ncbi:PAS domain-containing protein [Frigidibacter sp. MR17.14]|uniref:sensor histidine kinase n=1 Tax=Frigidibacter sp. MR17.14 TaxID=3126509 RepID=UPI003012CD02